MRFFFRHSVIFLGVIFLLILSSGCTKDTKMFSEISNGFSKSINLLNKEPGITSTGFGSDQNKKLFKIGIGIDRSIMTEAHLKQLLQSYLTNVASYTSEPDPQKLLEPYNLQIEEISKAEIGPAFSVKLIAEKPSGSAVISWKNIAFNDFEEKAREKGLTESMLKTLNNLSFSEEEILELTPEKIAEIFAPGTQLDGAGFDPDANQTKELQKVGIDINMSIILYNLGYGYHEMLELSVEELDFIFPNTELMDNLKQKGFSRLDIGIRLDMRKTYKDIIREALKGKSSVTAIPEYVVSDSEQFAGWKSLKVKDYLYSFDYHKLGQVLISYTIHFPDDWKSDSSVFYGADGLKIAEITPTFELPPGKSLFDNVEYSDPSISQQISEDETIAIGNIYGTKRTELVSIDGDNATNWYVHTYRLTNGKIVFSINFYESKLNSKTDIFAKVINTFKLN